MKKYQIIVPIMILFAIIGIWFYKSSLSAKNEALQDSSKFALDATEDFDLEQLKSYGLPIIVAFGADSCAPCKEMYPTLEAINKEYRGKVVVKFVDVWKNQDAAIDFPVRVIPTQFIFNADGTPLAPQSNADLFILYSTKETDQHTYTAHEGPLSKEQFIQVIKELGVE